jgi:uncharacterized membrane protein (DUF485 family)
MDQSARGPGLRVSAGVDYNSPVQPHLPGTTDRIHSESFLHFLMRRQLRLSVACAATFLIALLGLPLLNYFFPEFMARRVAGFTLTWLILGVLFFPLVWVIAWFFIRRSIALEQAEVAEVSNNAGAEK